MSFIVQDLVHFATATVLNEVRNFYTSLGEDGSCIKYVTIWSDNCASQFKSKATLGWAVQFAATHSLFSVV